MSATATKPAIYLAIGVFVGFLLGMVVMIAVQSTDTSESYADQEERTQSQSRPQRPARSQPKGGQARDPHGGQGADRAQQSFAKVHFMKKFVRALTEPPENMFPTPEYRPLIKEGASPLVCASCHDPNKLNMEGMKKNDPGHEAVEPFRRQRRGFMIPLMQKWVDRLNKRNASHLRKAVVCTDCHLFDPRDDQTRFSVLPPLMIRFVRALKERPKNQNPAANWKPLLKDPSTPAMLCSVCHVDTGKAMEQNLARFDQPPPKEYAQNNAFMVNLMERWVHRLNSEAKPYLVKAVVCLDCHDTDPRR
jgi:formate-dependent nitrite reductase cytochrome c552 subunit